MACVAFISAILGVAYPILLQVISALNEKYDSQTMARLFKKENEFTAFEWALYASLGVLFLYGVISALYSSGPWCTKIHNISLGFLMFLTAALIVCFLLLVKKTLLYSNDSELVSYLKKNYKALNDNNKEKEDYFIALTDILVMGLRKKQEQIIYEIPEFFRDEVGRLSKGNAVFPDYIYSMNRRVTRELVMGNFDRIIRIDYVIPGGAWLMRGIASRGLSHTTYNELWSHLCLLVQYRKTYYLMLYWENGVNAAGDMLYPRINQEDTDKREAERDRLQNLAHDFIAFNMQLGGYIIYKGETDAVRKILTFNKTPSRKNFLLPSSMNEVFRYYSEFHACLKFRIAPANEKSVASSLPIKGYYEYEENFTTGISEEREFTLRYIALLFLRLYTLSNYVNITPRLPDNQRDRDKWLQEVLPSLKTTVQELLANKELLRKIGYERIDYKLLTKYNVPEPIEYLDKLSTDIQKAFDEARKTQEVSDAAKTAYINAVTEILGKNTLGKYLSEFKTPVPPEGNHTQKITCLKPFQGDKAPFAANQEITYLDYDTSFANARATNFGTETIRTFETRVTKTYDILSEELHSTLDRLTDLDAEQHILIYFGAPWSNSIGSELKNKSFKVIDFTPITSEGSPTSTVLIIRKEDLPYMESFPVDDTTIEKYDLKQVPDIGKDYLYTSIIDLNENDELRREFAGKIPDEEMKEKVLLSAIYSIEIQWKNEVKILALTAIPFRDQSTAVSMKDEVKLPW